jgi:agmatinase
MANTGSTIGKMYGSNSVATFMGLPSASEISTVESGIALIGAPCATPYLSVGAYCSDGPKAIRTAMAPYASTLHHHDFDLGGPMLEGLRAQAVDCGDLPYDEKDSNANRGRIRSTIGTLLDRGAVPVVLGGDDSIPIPLFEAFKGRGSFTVLQVDAHIDWRDEVGGEHWGLSSPMRRASEMEHVERIIQVGQRGVGSARSEDVEAAVAAGVKFVSARDFHANGSQPVLDLIPEGANVLVTFDCDGLDPSIMPAVIGRAPGGLSFWQAIDLLHKVSQRARISSFDLVEFMPSRDSDGAGALVAGRIVANMIGLIARQTGRK